MPSYALAPADVGNAELSELADIRDPLSLRVNLVRAIARRLIPAEDGSLNKIDYVNKTATWDSIRPLPGELERMQACCRHFDAHPLLRLNQHRDNSAVLRLSDVLTLGKFERNPLYQELYRPIGIKHHMQLHLHGGVRQNTIVLLRSDRDFSTRDVKVFRAIAPLVAMLSKLADEREHFQHALASATTDRGIILLEEDGPCIAWANPCANQQLSRFFSWASTEILPPIIETWLARPTAPLLHAVGTARLKVTLVRNDRQRILLFDELPPEPAPQSLQKLGLTARQAEVLFWISRGKTNSEIGIILGASVHTINRHVEAVFQRLNVESRSAAMVAALEILGV